MEVDDLLPISALEHLLYCERQCALIHIDGVWIENEHTVAGTLVHERVDEQEIEARPGVRIARRVALRCTALGLWGFADVVEFHARRGGEVAYPVEYKKGVEGDAAARYFEVFDAMLQAPDGLRFGKRTRRPPENEVNALLSFGYALLSADCTAAVQGAGLDPAVGFLHGERPGRPALALDLMEEFRAVVVDRMVLAMLRLGQIKAGEFERLPTGEVRMSDGARKKVILEYQRRKQEEVAHPLTGQAATWGLLPHLQARLLARAVRQEGDYVPFLAR